MLDTYIKNRGSTKMIVHDNNQNSINQMNWDADYDGEVANISLDLTNNGTSGHYDIKLNNDDLARIFNIDSIDLPIDKRLKKDFKKNQINHDLDMYNIYLDDFKTSPLLPVPTTLNPRLMNYNPTASLDKNDSLDNLLQLSSPNSHISSPLSNQEIIIPLTIDDNSMKSYTLTPRKRHRRPRTHKLYKVYKHPRVTTSSSRKSKTKSKTQRKKRFYKNIYI